MANLLTHTSGLQINVDQLNQLRSWAHCLSGTSTWTEQDKELYELLNNQLITDNEECEAIHEDSLDSE